MRGRWARHYEAHLSGSGLEVCMVMWGECGGVEWVGLVGSSWCCGWVGVALSRATDGDVVCVMW